MEKGPPKPIDAFAAALYCRFAGHVGAAFKYAKRACLKTFGGCPATELPGNALTAVNGMVTAINKENGKF